MKKKIGLVLEGGGMRGAYTAGCLKWFLENDIIFDYAVSISATAIHLTTFVQENIQGLYDLSVRWVSDPRNIGFKTFLKEGQPVGYDFVFDYVLKDEVPLNIEKIRSAKQAMEFGVYEMDTDTQLWINNQQLDDNYRLLKASCVLPLGGRSIKFNNHRYIDGGVRSMMPIFRSIEMNMDKHVCITTKHESYVRKPNSGLISFLISLFYWRYPQMIKGIADRVAVYYREMGQIDELVKQGNALLLRPSKLFKVSRLSAEKKDLEALFLQGYMDCESKKAQLLAFINE
jgi:predicted patatin/cPLA2 family phospholipase